MLIQQKVNVKIFKKKQQRTSSFRIFFFLFSVNIEPYYNFILLSIFLGWQFTWENKDVLFKKLKDI